MIKFTFRKFLVALITFASLAFLPNSGFAQRTGGSRGGGGFGPGAFRGTGPGASGGRYGRSGVYSGASQNRMFGGTQGYGATGFSRMSRGTPNASGQRSFANADGHWHSFSASRGGSVSHASGNGTVSPRSSSGESEWRYFGNHSDSSSASSQGPTAAHQPSSSPSRTSANAAATGSALKSVAPSGFGSNSALGNSRFGSNVVSSNLRPFSTFQANRNGLASGFNAGIGTGTVGRFSFNTVSVNHFGVGCFGCGVSFSFGVGFGFGWPWGWSSWWGPGWGWGWWNPFRFTPWYYPWGWNWGYYPPPPIVYSGPLDPHDQPTNNPPSDSSAPSNKPTTAPPPTNSPNDSSSESHIAQGSQPATSNVESAGGAVHLYLKDGAAYTVQDCWMAYGKVHYTFSDGAESAVDIDQLDLQRTLDENSQHLCTVHETEPYTQTLSTEQK